MAKVCASACFESKELQAGRWGASTGETYHRPSALNDEDLVVLANSRVSSLGRSYPHLHTFSHVRETLALAREELEDAIQKNGKNKDAYSSLILANLSQFEANPEGAVEVCRRFEKAFPGDADMHFYCAYAYLSSNDKESAQPHLEKAIELDSASYAIIYYSQILSEEGRADEARKFLEKFVEDNPSSPEMRLIKDQLDREEKALRLLEEIEAKLAENPDDFKAARELAEALSQSSQHDLAYEWHQKAYDMKPDDEWALRRLADFKMSRDPEGAVKLYKKLLGMSRDKVYTMEFIGQAYFEAGNFEDALAWYEKAERNPEHYSMLLFRIAECYDKMGKSELADEYSRRFIRRRKREERQTSRWFKM